jgi:divalent metal cation (Fe/Co/Zn/Cd) transporter
MKATAMRGQNHSVPTESALLARGRRLEHLTILWNALEAAISLIAGMLAGSIALVSFGLDSVIEVASAVVLLWRLQPAMDPERREAVEQKAHRLVGICFLLLAAYVAIESVRTLWLRTVPERSIPGIAIACAATVVMPLLGRAKRQVARELGSGALRSDSRQADFCAYLAAVLLVGLALNWLLGWWWADPAAALVMVPIIANEGVQGLRGEACDDCCSAGH